MVSTVVIIVECLLLATTADKCGQNPALDIEDPNFACIPTLAISTL